MRIVTFLSLTILGGCATLGSEHVSNGICVDCDTGSTHHHHPQGDTDTDSDTDSDTDTDVDTDTHGDTATNDSGTQTLRDCSLLTYVAPDGYTVVSGSWSCGLDGATMYANVELNNGWYAANNGWKWAPQKRCAPIQGTFKYDGVAVHSDSIAYENPDCTGTADPVSCTDNASPELDGGCAAMIGN